MGSDSFFGYANISASGTTTIKSGVGILHAITINTTAAAAITIYDSLTGTGNKIGTIAASPAIGSSFIYNIAFTTGLTIVAAGNSDLTISFR